MKWIHYLLILLFLVNCQPRWNQNNLAQENSPYLSQHQANPVWWQSWNPKTLNYSKKSDKLIFLSIGYSSCHWCHVMNREVFSNADFADVANRNYVSIKIDREERPDLDAHFMKALNIITRSGGWPITLVLTPDLEPVFGATYVPLDKMIYILKEIQKSWRTQKKALSARGHRVQKALQKTLQSNLSFEKDQRLFKKFYEYQKTSFDPAFGGKKAKVKFPMNDDIRLLLRYHFQNPQSKALAMTQKTLGTIAKSGLFDHLDGGFHRYSTDRRWEVPHFEKMLYDQASFIEAYLESYQIKKNDFYEATIKKTLHFVLESLYSESGGFFSAINAENQSGEETFYTWIPSKLKSQLSPDDNRKLTRYYSFSSANKSLGKHRTLLRKSTSASEDFFQITKKLQWIRSQNLAPQPDRKIITAWNGQILATLARIQRLWPETQLTPIIDKSFGFLKKFHQNWRGQLYRSSIDHQPGQDGVLDDYAFLIHGLIEDYQTHFHFESLQWAYKLQKKQNELFFDNSTGNYFYSNDRQAILKNLKIFQESVRPSGQALAFYNLVRLSQYFSDSSLKKMARKVLNSYPDILQSHPQFFSYLLMGLDSELFGRKELVIAGTQKQCQKVSHSLFQSFFPYLILACASEDSKKMALTKGKNKIDGKMTFYVCEQGSCRLPTHSIDEATKQIVNH